MSLIKTQQDLWLNTDHIQAFVKQSRGDFYNVHLRDGLTFTLNEDEALFLMALMDVNESQATAEETAPLAPDTATKLAQLLRDNVQGFTFRELRELLAFPLGAALPQPELSEILNKLITDRVVVLTNDNLYYHASNAPGRVEAASGF